MTKQYLKIKGLGTDCELWYKGTEKNIKIEKLFSKTISDFGEKFTRFTKYSELSRFNLLPVGGEIRIDDEFFLLYKAALKWFEVTEGVFNPFILPELLKVGYDRSFSKERGQLDPDSVNIYDYEEVPEYYPKHISEVDKYIERRENFLRKLKPITMDFGGIGKGFLVDKLVNILQEYSAEFIISLGGDLYVYGEKELEIPIEDASGQVVSSTKVANKAVATSSTQKRVFSGGNHIIDPSSGNSIDPHKTKQLTIVADKAVDADVLAKTLQINPNFNYHAIPGTTKIQI